MLHFVTDPVPVSKHKEGHGPPRRPQGSILAELPRKIYGSTRWMGASTVTTVTVEPVRESKASKPEPKAADPTPPEPKPAAGDDNTARASAEPAPTSPSRPAPADEPEPGPTESS